MTTQFSWIEFYKAAVLETDWTKMEERIQAAEAALHKRKKEFDLNHGGTPKENQAIQDALNALNILRREVVGWSGSQLAS